MKPYMLGAALALCSLSAVAEEKKEAISADIELGVILTSGNTETSSYKARIDVTQNLKNWKNQIVLEGLYNEDKVSDDDGTEDTQTTAEKYFGSMKSDYKIDKEYQALFVYGEYDHNRFSGFEYQYSIALGYSNRLFTTDNSYFSYSVGPGLSVQKAEWVDQTQEEPEEDKNAVVYGSIEYVYNFSETAKFKQTISTNYAIDSDENTKTKSVTSVTANINSSLAMKASYTVDYNTHVNEDAEHADTQTALTIVYSFH